MKKHTEAVAVPDEMIMNQIYYIRGHKVMIDRDLATLYNVEIRILNQSVKRNSDRFPEDFMFQLTKEEYDSLRSQFVTLENKFSFVPPKYPPTLNLKINL